jgi:hypothetical protein
MATLRATTSSTWSRVDPDTKDEIEAIVAEYDFWGAHEELTVDLHENSDGDTVISIHGYAAFEASKPVLAEDGSVADREHGYTEEFLERIAPHLEEQLVIETVGHEKCRFPLLAGQWSVWPDGTIKHNHFERESDITKPPTEDTSTAALTELLNSEDGLNASNDLEYLLGLAGDALYENEHFEDDFGQAKWVVAQWCQELQYVPDLREYTVGKTVPKDTVSEDRETAELREWKEENQQ